MARTPAWLWLAFPALTMSLGWALRGFIGGGPLGAMIPGAMAGLALCLLLGREADVNLVAAFAAIGIGFGGEMTYGQTVGLSFQPATYGWALAGFAVKGGAWGLLGGAVAGVALAPQRLRARDLTAGMTLLVAGTWAGWKLVNQPRLVYFSNPVDKPRPEVWAGLLAGALLLLAWLGWRGAARIPARFALWGGAGGGIGFAVGAALQVWGRNRFGDFPLGWWKVMELTFGALLGLALGWCALRNRDALAASPKAPAPPVAQLQTAGAAALAIATAIAFPGVLHTRFNFVIAGALLLAVSFLWRPLAWQVAITATCCAFALDLLKNKPLLPSLAPWMFVTALTLASAVMTVRRPRAFPLYLWLMWTAVAVSVLKSFVPFESARPLMMESLFAAMALAATACAWRAARTSAPL